MSFVPVPYARRLVVTSERKAGFYQAHYETLPADAPLSSFEPCEDLSATRRVFEAGGTFVPRSDVSAASLETVVSGAGTLDTIQFTPDHEPTETELEAARIRITWDNQSAPAVDAALGSFFGSGLGPAEVRAIPFSMGQGVYESRFRMPYWSGFHLEITGISGELKLHTGAPRYTRGEAGYFHAVYSEARPTTPGEDFEWLSVTGAGKLVGTVLTVRPATPTTKKWWEGDLRSYANGRRTPGLNGTGHEDDHFGGWSNTFLAGPFSLPLHGEPRTELLDQSGQFNANTTLYRFYPGIDFDGGVRHSVEHGNRNGVACDYTGVAFYYADSGGTSFVETDALVLADDVSRTSHAYQADNEAPADPLESSFEGRADRVAFVATPMPHTGTASFTLALAEDNHGCFLRRLYDQANGRQSAVIRADGVAVGIWYAAESNATLRWAERDYFLPSVSTAGKKVVHLEVIPDAAAPAWSPAEYSALCVVP